MNIIRQYEVSRLNSYRYYSNLPTVDKVCFVEKLWQSLQKKEIKKAKWEKILKEKNFSSVPQKLPEKWWTPNGITQAFIKNQKRLCEVNYLHRSMIIHNGYEDSERDIKIMQSLFKHSARSLIDKNIVLRHASSIADDPYRIRVFRDGVVEYFNANEFELIKKKN